MGNHPFSQTVSIFHELALPEGGMKLAGYAALIQVYDLKVPLPARLSAISSKHKKYETEQWAVFTPKHNPPETLIGHLTFALKYEGVDLGVLSTLFHAIKKSEVLALIADEPTGQYSRRIWFLYEWLMETQLDIPDISAGDYVDVLDDRFQFASASTPSKRHRVRNNLPGSINFCPLIRRTEKLEALMALGLSDKAKKSLGSMHPDVLARAAAFLLLKDSKASYAIEGERPPHNRAERWGRALGQAGQQQLTLEEFLRLQNIVIEDQRFIHMGWRNEGGFIGVHDRANTIPIPDHISARHQDILKLVSGLIETDNKLSQTSFDPVLASAMIAFGFVFIHPFEDGNGRIHRFLIHHVLAEMGFAPKGIVFPVSATILERIDEYRQVLESYSKPRLSFIQWKPTASGNVEVTNETINLYRYFDATAQAEFLYDCVRQTIETNLPEEVMYLVGHDKMRSWIDDHFDMPDRQAELLISFLRQGQGKLSNRALGKEFSALKEDEVKMIEAAFLSIFSL